MGQLLKLFKLLNADVSPMQIAAGIAMGMILGFTPLWSLHNLLTLFIICMFRINTSAVLVSFAVFSGFAYLLDPVFIQTGEFILAYPELKPLWTSLYQQDIWRLAHFNHTLLMGSLAVSLVLWLPLLFIARLLIIQYRERIMTWVLKSKVVQALKASKWYSSIQAAASVAGLSK
ncbi:MAG: TIGR03546 family protein [Pseudomonadales bacterium]|nr:TIGR03546 family protein [Pseudomonadales bacterium]